MIKDICIILQLLTTTTSTVTTYISNYIYIHIIYIYIYIYEVRKAFTLAPMVSFRGTQKLSSCLVEAKLYPPIL